MDEIGISRKCEKRHRARPRATLGDKASLVGLDSAFRDTGRQDKSGRLGFGISLETDAIAIAGGETGRQHEPHTDRFEPQAMWQARASRPGLGPWSPTLHELTADSGGRAVKKACAMSTTNDRCA